MEISKILSINFSFSFSISMLNKFSFLIQRSLKKFSSRNLFLINPSITKFLFKFSFKKSGLGNYILNTLLSPLSSVMPIKFSPPSETYALWVITKS